MYAINTVFSLVFAYPYASLQAPFQPTKAIFVGVDVLLSVCVTLLPIWLLCPIYACQAAVGVGESYDALSDLFERVTNFLTRFRVYTEKIPQSPTMSNIMVKIMTEVLNVFALATKHINQGRFSKWPIICPSSLVNRGIEKFIKRLLGERHMETTLQRLDQLTQEEALMTGARTLEVVRGLSDDLRVVRDGKKPYLTGNQITNETYWSRRKGVNAWYKTSCRYVRPV